MRDWALRAYDTCVRKVNEYPNIKTTDPNYYEIEFRRKSDNCLLDIARVTLNDQSELKFKAELIAVDFIKNNRDIENVNEIVWNATEIITRTIEDIETGFIKFT